MTRLPTKWNEKHEKLSGSCDLKDYGKGVYDLYRVQEHGEGIPQLSLSS